MSFAVIDPNAVFDPPVSFPITIQNGADASETLYAKIPVLECGEPIVNNVEVLGWYVSQEIWLDRQITDANCPCEVGGDEGCTPGFWKNQTGCWCETYEPNDIGGEVAWFIPEGDLSDLADDTLLDALNYGGGRGPIGAARNLLRHATAALLNACRGNVEYKYTEGEIIAKVDAALLSGDRRAINTAKDDLARENERGCPISSDNAPEGIACERNDEE